MQKRKPSFKFCDKKDNVIGLQIADLTAYPLARHLLNYNAREINRLALYR
jgi:hypothetical protein